MGKIKTLKIGEATHEQLKKLGKLGETYEDVIKRLIEHYKDARK